MATVQERSRSRRKRVLAAALEVFSQHGYGETGVDEIARVSETSKGGLYFHFPSKQSLFTALLDEASAELIGHVERAMAAEKDPLAKGEGALREVLHVFGGHRVLARLLLIEAVGAGKEFNVKLAELHDAFAALIAGCLNEAVSSGSLPPLDTKLAARAWYGAVNQVVLHWLMTGEPERLEDAFPALWSLLLFGVAGTETNERT